MTMKIFVSGACGYKGTALVPKLLDQGHHVSALDTMWFGNFLAAHERLNVVKGDVGDVRDSDLQGIDAIIHLSSVANDPCGDLDPTLTWEISCLATMQLADAARRSGVKQFIYASSGSVYGIKDEEQVTEDLSLEPVSAYNKAKMVAERVLLSYSDEMIVQIIRPATVCGFSPRMRFDVSVNMLTMQALANGEITVFGGDQIRPNIHMEDITDVYLHFLQHPEHTGIFNAGFENLSIRKIAETVSAHVPAEIVVTDSVDPRSYRLNSDKLLASGFSPKYKVEDAITDLAARYAAGALENHDRYHNLKWMQAKVLS